jgi:murein DD-endopeptidase MepM/ murein hydrolase activator NlpD
MRNLLKVGLVSLFIFLAVLAGWLLWQARADAPPPAAQLAVQSPTVQPTNPPTIPTTRAPTDSPTRAPTQAAPPTATAVPTTIASPTPPPTSTPAPTATPSPTPTLALNATPAGQPCPLDPPGKPEYARYYLSGQRWPQPNPAIARVDFWLSKPLPGGGRLLINQTFPYGSDGNGRYLLHNGVDTAEKLGTPVLAVADGVVVVAQSDEARQFGWRCDWYGNLVVLELDQTWQDQPIYVLYGHVLNLNVVRGQRVRRGEPLAEVGFGGAATAPHLHLEVRVGRNAFDATRNPMLWIEPSPARGVVAGRLVDPEGRPWQGVPVHLLAQDGAGEDAVTWSYLGDPQNLIRPDEALAENFVFADVRPGAYELTVELQNVVYRAPVTVSGGRLSVAEIVTEAFRP